MGLAPALLLLTVTFGILVAVLRWFMGRYATTATAHLQGLSQDYLRKQDELKKRLEEAERLYQEQIAKAQSEAQDMKRTALKEAETARQELVEQARQEAERIVQQAIKTRDTMQQEAAALVETRSLERAAELIRKLLPTELREAVHTAWVGALLKNGLIRAERLELREDLRQARVATAFALTPAQRDELAGRLREVIGRDVEVQEQVDPRMIAGLVITLGHMVMDGSLATKLQEAVRHAQRPSE